MMSTTTIKYTKSTNVDYNLSWMVKKLVFKALLKVDSESLCLRANGRSFHLAGWSLISRGKLLIGLLGSYTGHFESMTI